MSPGDSMVLFRALPIRSKFTLPEKRLLNQFALRLSHEVAEDRWFTCLITNDGELRKLNKHFLGHDYATDVLSFPSADEGSDLGELAISVQRAEAQAKEFGHSCLEEVRVLMLHGLLHLAGMDHERDDGQMARAERKLRSLFGLPPTLIARAKTRKVVSA